MGNGELDRELDRCVAGADARVSLLVKDMDTGGVLHAFRADEAVSSASMIKVPILLAALERVRKGRLSLEERIEVPAGEILDDTEVFDGGLDACTLRELLYWMIVASDNTAANVLIGLLGAGEVNGLAAALGLRSTVLARKMLDFEALRAGRDNTTSAADMAVLFEAIYRNRVLTPALCGEAMAILRRQRSADELLRYISDDVPVAHKTGGLDPDLGHDRVCHDAGIFFSGGMRYYLGIFITGAPDDERYAKRLIGRLSRRVYDCYKG